MSSVVFYTPAYLAAKQPGVSEVPWKDGHSEYARAWYNWNKALNSLLYLRECLTNTLGYIFVHVISICAENSQSMCFADMEKASWMENEDAKVWKRLKCSGWLYIVLEKTCVISDPCFLHISYALCICCWDGELGWGWSLAMVYLEFRCPPSPFLFLFTL